MARTTCKRFVFSKRIAVFTCLIMDSVLNKKEVGVVQRFGEVVI